eukprot:6173113-Pleurochrysis_carterae.AAC.3
MLRVGRRLAVHEMPLWRPVARDDVLQQLSLATLRTRFLRCSTILVFLHALLTKSACGDIACRYLPPIARLISEAHGGSIGELRMLSIREHRFPFLRKVA